MNWNDVLAIGAIIWIAMLLGRLADAEAEIEVLQAYRDIRDRQDDKEEQ